MLDAAQLRRRFELYDLPQSDDQKSNLQLTRTPPLSALSVSVASWRWRETNDDLVLRERVNWLDTRGLDHAGLLRDVGACVSYGAVGRDILYSSCA